MDELATSQERAESISLKKMSWRDGPGVDYRGPSYENVPHDDEHGTSDSTRDLQKQVNETSRGIIIHSPRGDATFAMGMDVDLPR